MHPDLPLEGQHIKKYMSRWTLFSIMWGIAGSMTLADRAKYSDEISQFSPIDLPPKQAGAESIIDFEVRIEDAAW